MEVLKSKSNWSVAVIALLMVIVALVPQFAASRETLLTWFGIFGVSLIFGHKSKDILISLFGSNLPEILETATDLFDGDETPAPPLAIDPKTQPIPELQEGAG